jgi:iron complex outermembrane receptor protein
MCVSVTSSRQSFAQAPARAQVDPPEVVERVDAEYPITELAAKHEATVVLTVTVGVDGTVQGADVTASAGSAFDDAALAAVKQWRFSPAVRAGVPVASRIRVPFRFELPRAPEPGSVSPAEEVPSVPPAGAIAPSRVPTSRPAPAPAEVTVVGERERRTETRSSSDFRVTRDVLSAAPRSEGAEVLRTAPGLYIGRGEGASVAHSYMLRGFDAEHGQDIEFKVGGLPINQPSHLHGQGYADLGFLIGECVRELNVSEGVYDPRQGDFAVAGSIDVELGVEPEERGIELRSGYGSFDSFRQLVLYAPEDAERETFGAVQYTRTDGFGENRAGQAGSGMFQFRSAAGTFRYRALGILHASRANLAGVLRADDVESGRVCFHCVYPLPTAKAQNAAASRALVGLFAESRGQNGENGELGVWFDRSHFRVQANFTGFVERSRTLARVAGRGDLIEQLNQSDSVGVTSRYRTAPYHPSHWAHGTVEVGADGRLDGVEQSQNLIHGEVRSQTWDQRVDASVQGVDLGVWGDLDWHFFRYFHTRLGFRADILAYQVNDRLGNFVPDTRPDDAYIVGFRRSAMGVAAGPRASVEVRPFAWLSVMSAYGEGYRSPQARVLADGEDAPFTKVRSADVGARFDWGDALKLSVGGYYTTLSDDVAFEAEEGRLERIGKTRRLGAVMHLVSRPVEWLVESLSVTVVDATLLEPPPASAEEPVPPFEEGQNLPFVPPVVVRADLGANRALTDRLPLHTLRGRAGAGFSFLSPRPLPYGDFAAPVALLDASIGIEWGPLDVGFELYNLFDAEYAALEYNFASDWTPGSARSRTPVRHVAAGAPRSWMVNLGVTL